MFLFKKKKEITASIQVIIRLFIGIDPSAPCSCIMAFFCFRDVKLDSLILQSDYNLPQKPLRQQNETKMSHNWLSAALSCFLMPACLFDANSVRHARTRLRAGWQIALSLCFCPFFISRPPLKSTSPGPPSRLITVLSCHIIQAARSGGGSVSRGRCAELWDGQAFCGLSDSIRQTTRLFCLAVDMPETSAPDKDTSVRITERRTNESGHRQIESRGQIYLYLCDTLNLMYFL